MKAISGKQPARNLSAGKQRTIDYRYLPVIWVITAIVFAGVLSLGWTNWDDELYVLDNPLVKYPDLSRIFTEASASSYNPLVVLSWAIEWSFTGPEPWLYHLDNLLLHLACSSLVFILLSRLGLKPIWAAIGSLLFSLHPFRVESVAWITERKDLLYALFYLAALWQYLVYVKSKKWLHLAMTFLLFSLSLLSKIQAVTLPPLLILADWYSGRKINLRTLAEKIPFFAAALAIGLLGVHFLQQDNVIAGEISDYSFWQRLVFGMYAYSAYLIKFFIPYITCAFHPRPQENEMIHYSMALGALVLMVFAALRFRKNAAFSFAVAFFTIHVILLLQIVEAGSAFMADRFTYIACIGPFYLACLQLQKLSEKKRGWHTAGIAASLLLLAVFGKLTADYVKVWENSDTLWTDVIEKYPGKVVVAYVNRGHYLRINGDRDRAFQDFNTAIQIKPDDALSYLNRGDIYFERNEFDLARKDYDRFMQLKPKMDTSGLSADKDAGSYYGNMGAIYGRTGKLDSSLSFLRMAIKVNPENPNYYKNRGITYFQMGRYEESNADLLAAVQMKEWEGDVWNIIGVNYLRIEKSDQAVPYFTRAIEIDPARGLYYMNRAIALANLKDKAGALRDIEKGRSLGSPEDRGLMQKLENIK